MDFTLRIWRQASRDDDGHFENHQVSGVPEDLSFLEMLDELNFKLEAEGKEPIAFDYDCREGICGACGLYINGKPHGPDSATTTCQLFMRRFTDGETITVEPWRAKAFPVIKDLMVDRTAFDRIIEAGGYVSVGTGAVPEANTIAIPQDAASEAMDAAACIGCGACVAACKNASAALFTSAKISHLALLPQGRVNREDRVTAMVEAMDAEGFGHCTNEGECEAACPKVVKVQNISRMNREYLRAKLVKFFAG